jgi:uncharacterized protein (TIGR03437 family)
VRFDTSFGYIDVDLLPNSAPLTVANFLNYVNRGDYNNSFIHRSVPGFIIQGGGYKWSNKTVMSVPEDGPVANEFKLSNVRGTIAMAKLGSDPNSATNEWFFNLVHNGSNLDNQNGGFTVFGRIANAEGLGIIDRIAAAQVINAGSAFTDLPVINYSSGYITSANTVNINSITVLKDPPAIAVDGVITAGAFGGTAVAAPASFIEIYGSNLAGTTRGWTGSDFVNGKAPTALDGVTVTVGGKAAYVSYVSPTQVNVQVPGDVSAAGAVPVVVTYDGSSSAAGNIAIKATSGALLSPPVFKVGDLQYAAAFHHEGLYLVSNGQVPGVEEAPAKRGETLVFYGLGFGPVTALPGGSGNAAGEIATGLSTVNNNVEFFFGDVPAEVIYKGLSPGSVGLYQFNVIVPASAPAGDVAVRVLQGGVPIAQSLVVPIAE